MSDPLIAYDDLELYLLEWFRTALAERPEPECADVEVVRVEPPTDDLPEKLLVIRDDGATDTSFITAEASLGFTVLAGSKENPKVAKDLARIVHALLSQIPSGDPANPFAALLSRTSPVLVQESQPKARAYATATFAIAGRGI
ncbi:hypothetical protein [Microbacterium sp. 2FI]|uniref:hypothetical protein n=1 Tax=Microbacterium sp. 2FI TaxID=2502193 RepID=UPI0010F53D9A|nr:hypothetical protein [Microbacterium sp. 2FI]